MPSVGPLYASASTQDEDGVLSWNNTAAIEGAPDDSFAYIQSNSYFRFSTIQLTYNSSPVGDNNGDDALVLPPDPPESWSYGGASDTWNATPTRAMVVDVSFGVRIQWTNNDNDDLTNTIIVTGYDFSSIPVGSTIDGITIQPRVGPNNGGDFYPGIDSVGITINYTVPPPSNTVAPAVTGTAQQGETLTTDNGTWDNSPTSYAYKWQRSDDGVSGWADIGGETASTYVLVAGDVGKYVRSGVTATNAGGSSDPAYSGNSKGPVLPLAPTNSIAPVASGTAQVGQTLSVTNGTWNNSPTGYAYLWKHGDDSAAAAATATNSTYTPVAGDVGFTMKCVVTASNDGGSGQATSNETDTVTAATVAGTYYRSRRFPDRGRYE